MTASYSTPTNHLPPHSVLLTLTPDEVFWLARHFSSFYDNPPPPNESMGDRARRHLFTVGIVDIAENVTHPPSPLPPAGLPAKEERSVEHD